MFEEVIRRGSQDYPGDAVARMYIVAENLSDPIIVRPRPLNEMTAEAVLEAVMAALNSNEGILVTDKFQIQLGIAQFERGSGPKKPIVNVEKDSKAKKSIVTISNRDRLCLARAIAVCLFHWEVVNAETDASKREARKAYNNMRKGDQNRRNSQQKKMALQYHALAGVPTDRPCSLANISKFEEALDVDVYVFAAHINQRIVYPDYERPRREKRVYLFYSKHDEMEGHFDAITKVPGFVNRSYFCHKCLKGFHSRDKHVCEEFCRTCRRTKCPRGKTTVCDDCNIECRSTDCFDHHKKCKTIQKKEIPAPCDIYYKCKTCKTVLQTAKRSKNDHRCWEFKCGSCDEYYVGEHLCYLRIRDPKDRPCKYVFFDFECTQESGVHVPNFVVAQTVCRVCLDEPCTLDAKCHSCGTRCHLCNRLDAKSGEYSGEPCDGCAKREVIFSGPDTQKLFGEWLFNKERSRFTAIAHNGKSYDNYFLLSYLVQNGSVPKLVYNGSKIMLMHLEKGYDIRVLDSANFLPMRLAALPKAFGLKELAKGYFPHYFNTNQHWNYKGPYPPMEDYGIDSMSSSDRESFLQWYNERTDEFDFQQQMLLYCRNDVQLLREACMKFRELLIGITGDSDPQSQEVERAIQNGVDPLAYLTIASVCMNVFRSKFLTEKHEIATREAKDEAIRHGKPVEKMETIKKGKKFFQRGNPVEAVESKFLSSPLAMIPAGGYVARDQYSKISIQWLEWESRKRGVKIRHALNEGEVKFPAPSGRYYKLDGFYIDPVTCENVCLEYNSCVHHGCLCQDRESMDPYNKQSMAQRYAQTMEKVRVLEEAGIKVVTKWDHEFRRQLKNDPELVAFVETLDLEERLEPRDAFFGGRTNAVKMYRKAEEGEKIKYVDFTSLYPTVNKYDRYPVGHPTVITSEFADIRDYFGIAKVKMLPPNDLYHPVLPVRCHGKLLFPLCRTCAENKNQKGCSCSDEQRVLLGTWTTLEIRKAIDKGYRIVRVYEVYHWPESTQYDPRTGKGGLFSEYVNAFLKVKQESSGWPEWCKTEEDKDAYLSSYERREGIALAREKVKKNPGLRSLAKLCLNR